VADDFEHPTYSSETQYDLIVCSDVIEHMEDPDMLLSYIKKFAHKDGTILFSTPERDVLRGKDNMHSPNRDHIREWNKEEFTRYLTSRGFTILGTRLLRDIGFNFSKSYKPMFSWVPFLPGLLIVT